MNNKIIRNKGNNTIWKLYHEDQSGANSSACWRIATTSAASGIQGNSVSGV